MNINNQVGSIDGHFRIKGKHSIGFSYYELEHSGTTNAGLYTDQSLLAEYRFWEWGGIGGGLNINTLKLNAKDDDAERQLDLSHGIGAAQLYLFFIY
jgi:hypothetical protein